MAFTVKEMKIEKTRLCIRMLTSNSHERFTVFKKIIGITIILYRNSDSLHSITNTKQKA